MKIQVLMSPGCGHGLSTTELVAEVVRTHALDAEVETILVEEPDAMGPYGAKEVGQGPLLPIPPALANAVHDALGVRVDEVPITPHKVLAALAAPDRRYGPAAFPDVPWPEPLLVPPPWEGGDGKATNDRKRERRLPGAKP